MADYPDLRDAHDAELQAAFDAAVDAAPNAQRFWEGVRNKQASVLVADVTDLRSPSVAGYNPELMLYAASIPKVAIVFGAMVEIQAGALELDDETRTQLVNMVRKSSNEDASAVLSKLGIERLGTILQDERHGKLYDPEHGGGLWVGKSYDGSPVWQRDPLHGISHGASAMQVARFYYGWLTGTLVETRYLPLFREIFGNPGLKHNFVKGLSEREGLQIYRKSGTWKNTRADSAVVERDDLTYIVVGIYSVPEGTEALVAGIEVVDDFMLEWSRRKRPAPR
ncbi:MAG: serine hydrolase [Deltaproteobacteria bacterium]|nr:serine hydrolase [Deltaproteobacteria bacterium]